MSLSVRDQRIRLNNIWTSILRIPRIIALVSFLLLIVLAASFLGGNAISYFVGGSHLDIDGRSQAVSQASLPDGWSHYGGDAGGNRYSNESQISTDNVDSLEIAWSFSTGNLESHPELMDQTAAEGTPILLDGKLTFCTPFNEIIALHPGTGAEIWRYDPKITTKWPANQFVCRGIVAHTRSDGGTECPTRILMGTNDGRVVAVDASTGEPCSGFGDQGQVTLDPGTELLWPGEFQVTSPPVVLDDTVIVGSSISDNERVDAPAGAVRAYNAITGALEWTFDPIPRNADNPAASTWEGAIPPREGGSNVWAPMSVDVERGLVFLPTSSASPDFYGGGRPGDNKHANSVVALNVKGELVWAYQIVHHDIWDYDLPAQPGLYTVATADGPRDVVAQVTKTGHIFVLDRDTGEPVLPVEERPVPQQVTQGETLSKTQPFPVATPAIVPSGLSPDDAFGVTWFDREQCRRKIASAWSEGLFSAPTEQGTIIYPFNGGGANWGGSAYDPARNLLVINMSNMAHILRLVPPEEGEALIEHPVLEVGLQTGAPYAMVRELLISSLGLPCSPPPWGIIAGIDISSGEIVWRQTLGTSADVALGLPFPLGTPNFGGPIVTAGGLVFIGAAMDNYLRAFDVETGAEVWKGRLPGGGQATPMSYVWEGRQYVAIYAGGHSRAGTTINDELVAFSLPLE